MSVVVPIVLFLVLTVFVLVVFVGGVLVVLCFFLVLVVNPKEKNVSVVVPIVLVLFLVLTVFVLVVLVGGVLFVLLVLGVLYFFFVFVGNPKENICLWLSRLSYYLS